MSWNRRSMSSSPLAALQQSFDAICDSYPLRRAAQRDVQRAAGLDAVVLVATGGARSDLRSQRTKAMVAATRLGDRVDRMVGMEEPYAAPKQVDQALSALERVPIEQLSTQELNDLANELAAFRATFRSHERVTAPQNPALLDAITATVKEIYELRANGDGRRSSIGKTVRLERLFRDVERNTNDANPLGYTTKAEVSVPTAFGLALALDRFADALARNDNIHLRSRNQLAEACADGQAFLDAEVANVIADHAERIDAGLERLTVRIDRAIVVHQTRSSEILNRAVEQRDAGRSNTRGQSLD